MRKIERECLTISGGMAYHLPEVVENFNAVECTGFQIQAAIQRESV